MLISREKTRKILNEDEMITMMKELGFLVIVARAEEARNMNKFANTVNSCSVLVGAHGAGLTNELFLPPGAVMVQVEILGWNGQQPTIMATQPPQCMFIT
ncbi:UNVERIFIED_CONTAM: Alpha-1,3-arabinosyltransferase XAT3 [Sesamum radiatum]|uniref:Alpha-1,3-arabinosyltransferase XAT3 n=1 Tax=Sesamum radiatum TaxID=300843 RepID=A0AAW2KJA0_SESRA